MAVKAKRNTGNTPASKKGSWGTLLIILLLLGLVAGFIYLRLRPGVPVLQPEQLQIPICTEAQKFTKAEDNLVYGGLPRFSKTGETLQVLRNRGYFVGFSNARGVPLWVAYRLDRTNAGTPGKRPPKFRTDTRVQRKITHDDYVSSGYDRGHLAPNFGIGSRFGREAQLETFLMTNVMPMTKALNRKVWERLERLEAEYANRYQQVWIITGPIFDPHREWIHVPGKGRKKTNPVEIPDAFYKIIVDEDPPHLRALALIVPQTVIGNEPLSQFLVSIDQVEQVTDLDFLWGIVDEFEDPLEAHLPPGLWTATIH